jgi:gamma-glutamyltranspeptidase/glutathione hydrolase
MGFLTRSLLLFAALGGLGLATAADQPEAGSGVSKKQSLETRRFLVVAANPLASEVGAAILRAGGNAMDAAVAVQLVLGLVEPQSSGIGGGAFLLVYSAHDGRLRSYDGRETAPAGVTPRLFLDETGAPRKFYDAVVGGRAIGAPGVLRLLELAHRNHGQLDWSALFEPAARLAEDGFFVSPRLNALLTLDKFLPQQPAAAEYFYAADRTAPPVGARLRNPHYAALLRRLAVDGVEAFYNGTVAQAIAAAASAHPANPGVLAASDLSAYRAIEREPLCGRYRQWKVCGMAPPSSGGIAVLQMLGVLQRFDLASLAPNSAAAAHLFSEAGRLAYADRNMFVADPAFTSVPVAGLLAGDYLSERASRVRLDRSMGTALPGQPAGQQQKYAAGADSEIAGTSHFSIVDAEGNAVAMSTTIEDAFGSRQWVHGFLLNNQLTDFSFVPERNGLPVANRVEAGKRPRSSMAPTMVFDTEGRLRLVIGSPGGAHIINYVTKVLIGVLDWQLDIQRAIDLPNVGSRNGPTELERDSSAAALVPALEALGHEVRLVDSTSGLHGIERIVGGWRGGADPRREGEARGE